MRYKFKKGDRVKRISYSDSPEKFGEMGKTYTVSRVGAVELFLEEIPNLGGASPKAFILAPNHLPEDLFIL